MEPELAVGLPAAGSVCAAVLRTRPRAALLAAAVLGLLGLVAVVLSPRALDALPRVPAQRVGIPKWGETHMIPRRLARAARMTKVPRGFDDD